MKTLDPFGKWLTIKDMYILFTFQVVNWALDKLRLVQYKNQTAGTLSGGNKRKLSTAISLVGNPSLLYMVVIHSCICL